MSPAQREHIFKVAWFAALSLDKRLALDWLPEAVSKPWVGETPLQVACELASATLETSPEVAESLMLAAARQHPSLALRAFPEFSEQFPFWQKILAEAIALEPAEAYALASAETRTGRSLREQLGRIPLPWAPVLIDIATRRDLDRPTSLRLASLVPVLDLLGWEAALGAARNPLRYFQTLLAHRHSPAIRRSLERFCQRLLVELRQSRVSELDLHQCSPQALIALLVNGRREMSKEAFEAVFKALIPKLRGSKPGTWFESDEREAVRVFLDLVLSYRRASALLSALTPGSGSKLWGESMRQISTSRQPLEQLILAAEIVERTQDRDLLQAMAAAVEEESQSGAGLYGLLAFRLSIRLPDRASLKELARPFSPYFEEPRSLATENLFGPGRVSVHRYFFYNDDDGVESYRQFRRHYEHADGWTLVDHGAWVQVTGAARGKRIEIFANVPFDAVRAETATGTSARDRHLLVTQELQKRGWQPNVFVHRGHAYHLEQTLEFLAPQARLVYLGSCWGMENVDQVMNRSWSAQMIATRGAGSHTINDPLLKAINEELLNTSEIDWQDFWRKQEKKFGRNPLFQDYVPPHRNATAILLRAYYRYLAHQGLSQGPVKLPQGLETSSPIRKP
ncbi:MAG: hypothetical protein NZV14_00125 [Bryobacteraceae bacterium]|nr:hypothetical protein [Bryobacteraceae bacterium]MDW8376537.1 hypothetical protein [Bryobacterales bacterium]